MGAAHLRGVTRQCTPPPQIGSLLSGSSVGARCRSFRFTRDVMEAIGIGSLGLSVKGSEYIGALSGEEWEHVVAALAFSAQQARIVALILEEKADKEIAKEMGLRRATIRTHLAHIFKRARASTRVGIVLRVVACARQWREKQGDHPK